MTVRTALAAPYLEFRAVREHDGQCLDPRAHRAVLEGGGAGGIRGDDASCGCARPRRRRRKPCVVSAQRVLHDGDRHARFDRDADLLPHGGPFRLR